jgi:hypothetical protein
MSRLQVLAVVLALSAAACDSDNPITPITPSLPNTVTDTFGGTLNQNGGESYPFSTSSSGGVTATLSTLAPDSALEVGLSLGTWNGSACYIVIAKDKATQSSSVLGQATSSGSLCVRIYDVGNVTDPITFEIQVVHP